MKHHDSKRELVLQAAGEVVLKLGVNAMTLEAVARQANVSKGGLLYHFPNKEALIEAMNGRFEKQFEEAIQAEIEREIESGEGAATGRWLRGYVRASTAEDNGLDASTCALLAALGSHPASLNMMRQADERWHHLAINDGVAPATATIVRMAADGYWLSVLFGFTAGLKSPQSLAVFRNSLLELIAQGVQQPISTEQA